MLEIVDRTEKHVLAIMLMSYCKHVSVTPTRHKEHDYKLVPAD